jgi:hypothetical protein
LRSGDEIKGAKDKGGGRYRLQTLVYSIYVNQELHSIVLDKSLKDGVVNIKRQGDKIILVKLFIGDLVFNVISAYTP